MELLSGHQYLVNALLAGLCAGAACGTIGVVIVTMHLSSLGFFISHAAFAGALLGVLLRFNPLYGALLFSVAASGAVGPLAERGELNPDTSIGILFSLMLGLAFLFLGLIPGSRSEALSLFWGSILSVDGADLALLLAVAPAVVLLVVLFFKEIQAVICHREVALAAGVPAKAVFYALLFASGIVIAASLRSVGGLLIYALIVNPAAAALQLTYSLKRTFVYAAAFGVAACWGGLGASYAFDLPAGATVVLTSSAIFAVAVLFSPKRRRPAGEAGASSA